MILARVACIGLPIALAASCGGTAGDESVDFDAALRAQREAVEALREGDLLGAEAAAERAAAAGGAPFAAIRDFLTGNVAFARCERFEAASEQPDAESGLLGEAVAHAQIARVAWHNAAASRADWPAARRNVERALRKLEELERKAQAQRAAQDAAPDEPPPQPPEPGDEEAAVEAQLAELSPAEVARLLQRLAQKEAEKRELRRARRRVQRDVERDW